MIRELPPMPQGTAEQQLAALRDYLVRLSQSLDQVTDAAVQRQTGQIVSRAQTQNLQAVRESAEVLKALIVKNADRVTEYADRKIEEYDARYVAQSDFGSYYRDIETMVETTARGTVESYRYADAIRALDVYMTELNGQIRRGVMEDPDTQELHLGIAISENLVFTGQTVTADGMVYYRLSPGQTLGLYTSTGWQFWINGYKRGWFSSEDSMLHVSNIVVEDCLQLGLWQISPSGGLGIRYTGG
jgi:hypothetical protein